MKLVILKTPYTGDVEANEEFACSCMDHCLSLGEAPMASHLLYTQCLNDNDPEERELGIRAGHAWMRRADKVVVYMDRGVSSGMLEGIKRAEAIGLEVEYRRLDGKEYTPLESLKLGAA